MLLIVLIVLLLVLASGAGTYGRWGSRYPAWGGDALWLLVIVLFVVVLVTAFSGRGID